MISKYDIEVPLPKDFWGIGVATKEPISCNMHWILSNWSVYWCDFSSANSFARLKKYILQYLILTN